MAADWKPCGGRATCDPTRKKTSPNPSADRQQMHIVITGHVDHGKSTIIGRLLAETDSLPHGKLDQVRETCRRTARPFEYAFLLDALKAEQAQGITIDAARVFFHTAQARLHHHRRAGPHRVSQEHGHRRFARRGGRAGHRRRGGHPGKFPPSWLHDFDAGPSPACRGDQQDGPGGLFAQAVRRIGREVSRVSGARSDSMPSSFRSAGCPATTWPSPATT